MEWPAKTMGGGRGPEKGTATRGTEAQKWLSGRRSAGGAVRRKRIQRRNINRQRSVPSDLPGFGNQIERGGCQRRYVQRLANVAGSLRTASVLVDERAAAGEIQQDQAAHYG